MERSKTSVCAKSSKSIMGVTYKDLCALGSRMTLVSTAFIMGVFFSNQIYDYHLLFNQNMTQDHFDNALRHYRTMYETPKSILIMFGVIVFIGLVGAIIRIYKPNPDLQMFEYGSLAMFVLGVCVFLTNIKTGVESSVHGNWGEVTQNQGLAVIGSSNIILLIVFSGVIVLQGGLIYTEWEFQQRMKAFQQKEAAESLAAASAESTEKKTKGDKKKSKKEE